MNTRLKVKIIQSGKPQIALAKEIGVPEPVFSKIVNGWVEPKPHLKTKIARALDCTPTDIFTEDQRQEA